jgi:hypothetical protein
MNRQYVVRARVGLQGVAGEAVRVAAPWERLNLTLRRIATSLRPETDVEIFIGDFRVAQSCMKVAAVEKLEMDWYVPPGVPLAVEIISSGEEGEHDVLFLCDVKG